MPEAPSEHAADPSSTPSPDSLGVDSPQDATAEAMHGEDAALSSPGSPSALERLSAASEDKRIPATPPARSRLLTLAWAASFLILGLMGTAAYVKRDALMREWPASKRLYAMLGLWTPEKAVTQQASPPR